MFTTTLFCVLVATISPVDAGRPSDITDMVARQLAMPDQYHIKLRVESRSPADTPPARNAYTVELWRAHGKFRYDITDGERTPPPEPGNRIPGGNGARDLVCDNCERSGHVIHTMIYPNKPVTSPVVEFDTTYGLCPMYDTLNFDWRMFGLRNGALWVYTISQYPSPTSHYQKLLSNPELHLMPGEHQSRPCLVASTVYDCSNFSTHFDKTLRNMPTLYKAVWDTDGSKYTMTTNIYWQNTPGGHLYPAKIHHLTTTNGQTTWDQTTTVLHADFDTPVDPAVFTLAAFGLNDNQTIG